MDSKIVDYVLVGEYDSDSLTNSVREWITKGYEPIGGVSVVAPLVNDSPAPTFSQAMVRRE